MNAPTFRNRSLFAGILFLGLAGTLPAQPGNPNIASTDPKSPEDERKSFKVPAGVRGAAGRRRAGHSQADQHQLR